jgi:hypothetical protein
LFLVARLGKMLIRANPRYARRGEGRSPRPALMAVTPLLVCSFTSDDVLTEQSSAPTGYPVLNPMGIGARSKVLADRYRRCRLLRHDNSSGLLLRRAIAFDDGAGAQRQSGK